VEAEFRELVDSVVRIAPTIHLPWLDCQQALLAIKQNVATCVSRDDSRAISERALVDDNADNLITRDVKLGTAGGMKEYKYRLSNDDSVDSKPPFKVARVSNSSVEQPVDSQEPSAE